jgi:ATP-dependent Clp protease adaptor protein ClpS
MQAGLSLPFLLEALRMSEQEKVVPGQSSKPTTTPTPTGASGAIPGGSAAAPAKPKKKGKSAPAPKRTPPGMLPPWKVLLHNDNKNTVEDVIKAIVQLIHLTEQDAEFRTQEAHKTGVSLLTVTHKERAELFQEQFASKGLTVTIEPAE